MLRKFCAKFRSEKTLRLNVVWEAWVQSQSKTKLQSESSTKKREDKPSFPNTYQLSHHHSNQWHRLRSFSPPCCVDSLDTRQSGDGSWTCRVRCSGMVDREESPSYEEDRGCTVVRQPWFCMSTGLSANHRDYSRHQCCRSCKLRRKNNTTRQRQ